MPGIWDFNSSQADWHGKGEETRVPSTILNCRGEEGKTKSDGKKGLI